MSHAQPILAVSFAAERIGLERRRELSDNAAQAWQRTIRRPFRRSEYPHGFALLEDRDAGRLPSGGDRVDDRVPGSGSRRLIQLSRGPRSWDGSSIDPTALAESIVSRTLSDVAPPFAACVVDEHAGTVIAATDAVGLRHLYTHQGEDWSALSTSSLLLALVAGATVNEEALGTYALLGNYLGDLTPFTGVRVLPAGASVSLHDGRIVEDHRPAPPPRVHPRLDRRTAIDVGAEVVRTLVAQCLRAHPDSVLELSGGLDSRLLLAAVPTRERRGLPVVTVGPSGSADHRVASHLAARYHLAHTPVTLDGVASLPDEQVAALVEDAAVTRDCSGNAIALALLDWQEQGLPQAPRLTGQNGEFARGFYYAGQREHPLPTDRLIASLCRWRLFANDAADASLFSPDFVGDMRATAEAAVRAAFAGCDLDWLSATDEFYLKERMRHWVGTGYSAACLRRVIQAPFFHQPYLAWARSCQPRHKRGSSLLAAVLTRLDPELAAIPLDSGRTPRALGAPSFADRLTGATTFAGKAVRKIDQRARRRGRSPTGAAAVAHAMQRAWARDDAALASLSDLPFLDAGAVAAASRGTAGLDPASVGLLVNLDVATRLHLGMPTQGRR